MFRRASKQYKAAKRKAKRELAKVEADGQDLYVEAIKKGHALQSQLQDTINHMPFIPRAVLAFKILLGRWK